MPFVLLRHTPLRGRRAEAWLARVENVDPAITNKSLVDGLSASDCRGLPLSSIAVEHRYDKELSAQQQRQVLQSAAKLQTTYWPAYMLAAKLFVSYRVKDEYQGSHGRGEGGEELVNKMADLNALHVLETTGQRVRVQVVEVTAENFHEAATEYDDELDMVVLQVISAADAERAAGDAREWATMVESDMQRQLDQGASWEQAVSEVRVRDNSGYQRSQLCA